jgi:hypothetical protein
MPHCIAKVLGLLLRLLFPAPGRHRAGHPPPVADQVDPPTLLLPRGEDELVRPFMWADEERRERRKRRMQLKRRQTLRLASHGIDVGPSRIPGVEVAR